MIPLIIYTHSEYGFLWKACIPLLQRHAANYTIHWCCDVHTPSLPENFVQHIYDIKNTWSFRVKHCVDAIDSEYVIYLQEDWLLIGDMDSEKIRYLTEYMSENRIDF